jgi:hypothetical protein
MYWSNRIASDAGIGNQAPITCISFVPCRGGMTTSVALHARLCSYIPAPRVGRRYRCSGNLVSGRFAFEETGSKDGDAICRVQLYKYNSYIAIGP